MKYTYIIIALITIISATTSCDDFLEVKPKGKEVATNIEDFNGMFNATTLRNITYSRTSNDGNSIGQASSNYSYFKSDEFMLTPQGIASINAYFSTEARSTLRAFQYQDEVFEKDEYSAEIGAAYQHIYIYNSIIKEVMDAINGTEQEKQQLLSEARVCRAYMHFLLAQWFGMPYNKYATYENTLCVPIVTKPDALKKDFVRASVKEMYEFIINELEDALPGLEDRDSHILRVYKPTGYALLGRVYWMIGEYGKAKDALIECRNLLESEGKRLNDYNTIITEEWGYNEASPHSFVFLLNNKYPTLFTNEETIYVKQNTNSNILSTSRLYGAAIFIKPEFMSLYKADDERRKLIGYANPISGAAYTNAAPGVNFVTNHGMSLPDLYLMLAESAARTDDLSLSKECLLLLREKRMPAVSAVIPDDIASDKNKLIRFIVEERAREFMGTGMRWFDVRRLWNDPLFQDYKSGYVHTDGESTYTLTESQLVLPIPQTVLDFNIEWE